MFSEYGQDFIKTIVSLRNKKEIGVVFDQCGSPTYGKDLAEATLKILPKIRKNTAEIYHITNEGVCTWYDLACFINKFMELNLLIRPIHSNEFPQKAKRPSYSVLDKTKVKNDFKIELRHYTDALLECCNVIKGKEC